MMARTAVTVKTMEVVASMTAVVATIHWKRQNDLHRSVRLVVSSASNNILIG